MERPQSLASVGASHLDTDISVATGSHSIQNTAQQSISGREREREREEGGVKNGDEGEDR